MPRSEWRDHPGLGTAYVISILLTAGQGIALLAGGQARIVAPAFANVRAWGGPLVWGALLLAVAAVLAAAVPRGVRAVRFALIAAAVLYSFLGLGFLAAALHDRHASYWGVLHFAAFIAWFLSQSEEYKRAQPRAVHRDPVGP